MIHRPSRREVVKTTLGLAAAGSLGAGYVARAKEPTEAPGVGTFSDLDSMLRASTNAGELPGVVALAAMVTKVKESWLAFLTPGRDLRMPDKLLLRNAQ